MTKLSNTDYLNYGVRSFGWGFEWEWMFYSAFIFVCFFLAVVFGGLWYGLGARSKPVWAQKTAFECGFDPLRRS